MSNAACRVRHPLSWFLLMLVSLWTIPLVLAILLFVRLHALKTYHSCVFMNFLCLTDVMVSCYCSKPVHPHGQGSWLALKRHLDICSV